MASTTINNSFKYNTNKNHSTTNFISKIGSFPTVRIVTTPQHESALVYR